MTYEELIKATNDGIEIWKPIEGYEGYFEISNLGRVKSVKRVVKQGNTTRNVGEKIKKSHIGAYGYSSVTLCKNGKSRDIPIHRLLANAFIPNPYNKSAIDHINTDRTDYSLQNLRWVTPKENSNNILTLKHCREKTYSTESMQKRLNTSKNNNTTNSPKTVFQYDKRGNFIKEYYSMVEAERETGINHNSIHRVLNDNTQSAGNYLWSDVLLDNFVYNKRRQPESKPILQYGKDWNFIREWSSIYEASKALNIPTANITRSIKSNAIPRKYKFAYKT